MTTVKVIGMLLVVNTLDFTGSRPVTSFPSSAPSWPADDTLSSNHSVSQHPTRSDFPHLTPLTRNLQDGHNQRDLGRHGDQDDDSILKKLRNSSRLKDQRIPLPPESGQRPGDQLITPGTSSSATSKETFERSSHPTTGRSTNNVDYDLIIEQDNQNTIYHALNSDSNTIITAVMSDSSPDLKYYLLIISIVVVAGLVLILLFLRICVKKRCNKISRLLLKIPSLKGPVHF